MQRLANFAKENQAVEMEKETTESDRHAIRVLGFRYKQDKSKSIAHTTSSDKENVNMDTGEVSSSTSNVAKKCVEPKAESKDLLKRKGAQGKGKAGTGKSRKAHNISNKKNKNKKRKAISKGQQVSQKKQKTVKDEGLKLHLQNLNPSVTNLTNALAVLRRKLLPLERNRADIGREFRKITKAKQWDSVMYNELQMVRQKVTSIEKEIGTMQRNLNNTKSEIYKIEMSFKGKELDTDKYEDPNQT
ncbi:hypothetical protein BDA99DRAFT_10269 [Phascolomyces articulosus]|uniref:Uncharacterized protein n=1 Tax=Phascolomyces articulosus TaxID=60185 RepID=A0AAD5PKW6_9FUNG|nr:hypothetical protein BDA99DRAFT_10269 [Phascolomyces articulosus]